MNNETERAAFEAWLNEIENFATRAERLDDSDHVDAMWAAWQARASAATQAVPEPVALTKEEEEIVADIRVMAKDHGYGFWYRAIAVATLQLIDRLRAAPLYAAPVPPVALPALTDEQIDAIALKYPAVRVNREGRFTEVDKAAMRAFVRDAILAASAAPAPEQMQPNAQDKGHSALTSSQAPCGDKAVEQPTLCYSLDEEEFSLTELHDALDSLDGHGDLKAGVTIYEGEAFKQPPSYFFNVERILDDMGESAYDNGGGEWSEDFPEMSKEKQDELEALVGAWLDANVEVNFWGVRNVKAITVTDEMIRENGFTIDAALSAVPPTVKEPK